MRQQPTLISDKPKPYRRCSWHLIACPAECRGMWYCMHHRARRGEVVTPVAVGNRDVSSRYRVGEPGSEMSAMAPQGALDAARARVEARDKRRARLATLADWHSKTARKSDPILANFHDQASADIWVEINEKAYGVGT